MPWQEVPVRREHLRFVACLLFGKDISATLPGNRRDPLCKRIGTGSSPRRRGTKVPALYWAVTPAKRSAEPGPTRGGDCRSPSGLERVAFNRFCIRLL